jgi:hypothetical protein
LREALSNPFFVRPTKDRKPERLIQYLQSFGTEITFLAESPYTDRDFISDHSHYYATAHRQYPKVTKRLHFFLGTPETISDAIASILESGLSTRSGRSHALLQKAYLGFVVVKPLPAWVLGRTVVRPPIGPATVTCGRSNNVSLFGIPLSIENSLAWQEQDTVISACATTALWSAFHKTAHEFGYYLPTPYEITNSATQAGTAGRSIPSEGLTVEQMSHAIRAIGLDADMKEYAKRKGNPPRPTAALPLLSHCYAFLRGGIPVVLDVNIEGHGRHAVTLVGYELGEDHPKENELDAIGLPEPRMTGSRITRFVGHDDQTQPFVTLDVRLNAAAKLIQLETQWPYDINGVGQGRAKATPYTVITPIYHKIRVSPTSLMPHLAELRVFLSELPGELGLKERIEFDLYLCKSNDYKDEIARAAHAPGRAPILLQPLPRFIWRARCDREGKPLFEMIADSTDVDVSFQFDSAIFYDAAYARNLQAFIKTDDPLLKRLIPPMRRLLATSTAAAL